MNINGQNINIEDLVSQDYMHVKINKDIYLNRYQMAILDMYKIDYRSCGSTKDLIFMIDEVLDDEDDSDELEEILKQICEFDYYNNTHK